MNNRILRSGLRVLAALAFQVQAQTFQSRDQWAATFRDGQFSVYNNIWGGGAGSQCLTASAYNKPY